LAQSGENRHTSPSFYVLAFQKGWKDRNVYARINTADEPSTSDKK